MRCTLITIDRYGNETKETKAFESALEWSQWFKQFKYKNRTYEITTENEIYKTRKRINIERFVLSGIDDAYAGEITIKIMPL